MGIGGTLSQLPFFSEDRVDGFTLPPQPPVICKTCWEGPFAIQLGLPCGPSREGQLSRRLGRSFSYSTSTADLKSRAISGCIACEFLLAVWSEHISARSSAECRDSLSITVRGSAQEFEYWRLKIVQRIDVIINNEDVFTGLVHTTPGASGNGEPIPR